MDAFGVQKHWQSMDWHVNWNIASVQCPLYQHSHMFLSAIGLDSVAAAVVDNLVAKSIVVAHMFRMYHQFVRKPIVSVWLAVAVEYPMMHAVQLCMKLKRKQKLVSKGSLTQSNDC